MNKFNRENLVLELDEPIDRIARGSSVTLREYQDDCKAAIEKSRNDGLNRVIAVLATGLGKTVIFASMIHDEVQAGGKVLVVAHRDELLTQSVEKILLQGPLNIGIEANTQRCDGTEDVVVASVATIGRENSSRLNTFKPTLLIYDECHHAKAEGAERVIERFGGFDGRCFVVGFTATPHRMDNKPLVGKVHAGRLRPIFEKVVYTYTMREGIRNKFLCDLKGYIVRTKTDLSGVSNRTGDFAANELEKAVNIEARNQEGFERWSEIAGDRKTIVFCAGVEHSKTVTDLFISRGIVACHVDANTPKEQRRTVIKQFKAGQIQVLCNTGIYTEGFDVADVGCIMLMRPTQSWALHTQIVGRGTRLSANKSDCIVIDLVDNTRKHNICTLPALMELPPLLDLKGKSLIEAANDFDELSALKRNRIARSEFPTIEDFDTELAEIDLLGAIKLPPEIQKMVTLSWILLGEDRYEVCLVENKRAVIKIDTLGRWNCALIENGVIAYERVIDEPLAEAFKKTELAIARVWLSAVGMAKANAAWHKDGASTKQIGLLVKLGVGRDIVESMSKGDASKMIDAILSRRNNKQPVNTRP